MPWIYAVVGLLVGAILGIVISRLTTPQYKKQKTIQKDLESAKFALEQQRQELSDHFAQSAEMLDTLGKDYTKLYQHMAKTSAELLPNLPEQDNPFVKKIAEHNVEPTASSDIDEQPKDYANGATGLLREEQKQVIEKPELVASEPITAKAS
ncbi:Z-ring associated protein ZapG [Vibrio methylphosphonaticus]|uniref:Z-ring associated protein ZapG n=1 Tax=Vibrio methylphosphonaticus TaxID=2946866 RepID=UPI002029C1C7|nr:Z-ring associated protein ZapG [Vibrio methylphosphonaticus]MCL9775052.1 Z-ring associated protein ZapG [Vibrio methylphosphonaticus]